MAFVTSLALYFIVWWLVFFAVLPIGIENEPQDDGRIKGSSDAAPSNPMIRKKLMMTTLYSALLFSVVWAVFEFEIITFEKLNVIQYFENSRS